MAQYDLADGNNQCEVLFRSGVVTGSPFDVLGKIQVTYDEDEQDYYLDWKYHCPGGDEATSASEGYRPGDAVLIEADKNNVPLRVVGHYDGAEQCNIVYAAAWYASNYIYFKYNDTNRYFDIYNAVRNKYDELGIVSHFSGIDGAISIQFADGYPYRCVVVLELEPSTVGELGGYFLQGRYCIVDIVVDLDNWWDPFISTVYFYGLHKLYDDYPYWETFQVVGSDGASIPFEYDDENPVACGVNFNNPCSGSAKCQCTCNSTVAGWWVVHHGGEDPEWEECSCSGESPDGDCCYYNGDPYGCADGWDSYCCAAEACSEVDGPWTSDGSLTCESEKSSPIPVGTYAEETGMPEVILAGRRIYEYAWYEQERTSGTSCSKEYDCCEAGCGSPTCIYSTWTRTVVPNCIGELTKDIAVWMKGIDSVAADPEWNGMFDLGAYDYLEDIQEPADQWTQHDLGFLSCGEDDCVRGRSYQYTYTPLRLLSSGKWTYTWGRRIVEDIDEGGGCDCETTDTESHDCELVGFSYQFPITPDGQDPDNGGWIFVNNMLKGSLESHAIAWKWGSSLNHYRSTNPLGTDLELDSGLASPLDNPQTTAVLISDINNSGFTIGGGKVRAYPGFEINPETGRIRPSGSHLYEWAINFPLDSLMRNGCFMVYQPED